MIAVSIVRSCRPSARGAMLALALLVLALLMGGGPAAHADDALSGKPGDLTQTRPPSPVPDLTLTDMQEEPATLAGFRGKPLLLNLWATWCAPCIKEMPSLARLAAALKDQGLSVVAVSEDRGGKFQVEPFLKEHGVAGLPILLDKTSSAMKALKVQILPMTLLVDADGAEIGRVYGDRDWDTPASQAEIESAFGLKKTGR